MPQCPCGACNGQATSTHFHITGGSYGHATTVDVLPDNILLEISGFILRLSGYHCFGSNYPLWKWHRLVHVCRRWRQIIFSSPLRLDLQLLCTFGTPVKKCLSCWPAFPLVIDYGYIQNRDITPEDEDNIFAALEQRDRVRHIDLGVWSLLMAYLFAVMDEPFPALTHLLLSCPDEKIKDDDGLVIPNEFLGGSAPRLHEISLNNIPFPTIPAFLSSASNLVKLQLQDVPRTPFPSPEEMVACLVALTRLENISIEFQIGFPSELPNARPNQIRVPSKTWIILPAVASLYKGDSGYLEDFVSRINTPLLKSIDIKYLDEDFDHPVAELIKLIKRSILQSSRFRFARILFEGGKTTLLLSQTNLNECAIAIRISTWGAVGAQVVDMTRMLSQVPAMIPDVVRLDIEKSSPWGYENATVHNIAAMEPIDHARIRWLELFHPFIAVKTLGISSKFTESVARAFEELTVEAITQVLPALESLDLGGDPFMKKIADTFQASGRTLNDVGVER